MSKPDYPDATGRPEFDAAPLDGPGTAIEPAPASEPAPEPVTEPSPVADAPARKGGAASSTWVALIIGALLLILLLVFIMQNQQTVALELFAWEWNFPLGVGLLLAAITGALIMACAGAWKMFEMKRQLKRR